MGRIQAVLGVAKWAAAALGLAGCGVSLYIDDPGTTPEPDRATPPKPVQKPALEPATVGADRYYDTLTSYACVKGRPGLDTITYLRRRCERLINPDTVTMESEEICAKDPYTNDAIAQFEKLCADPTLLNKPGVFSTLPAIVKLTLHQMKEDYERALASRKRGELSEAIFAIKQGLCDGSLRLIQPSPPDSIPSRLFSAATCSEESTDKEGTIGLKSMAIMLPVITGTGEGLAELQTLLDWLRKNVVVVGPSKPEVIRGEYKSTQPAELDRTDPAHSPMVRIAVLTPSYKGSVVDPKTMERLARQLAQKIRQNLENGFELAPERDTSEARVLCETMSDEVCFPAVGKNMDVDYVILGDLRERMPGEVMADLLLVAVLDGQSPIRVRNYSIPRGTSDNLSGDAGKILELLGIPPAPTPSPSPTP